MDRSHEGFGELVVTRSQAAKLLKLVEKALDAIALAIELLVKGQFPAARRQRRDDRGDAVAGQALADAIGIVATIHDGRLQHVVGGQAIVEAFKLPAVVRLAGTDVERDGAVFIQGSRVDLGAESPARAAQSLITGVFFFDAPAA